MLSSQRGIAARYNVWHILFLLLFVIGGVFVLFSFLVYGDDGSVSRDELYQTACVWRYNEAPLGLLAYYIGKLWTDLFGFSILNLRYLTMLEATLSLAITTAFLWRKSGNYLLCGISFFLGCVLMKTTAYYFLNWDTGTYIFDAIALCILLSLISKPTTWLSLALGVAIGCITLGRTPSVLFLPAAMMIVWIACKHTPSSYPAFKAIILIFIGWLFSVLAFTTLIVGSPINYVDLFIEGNVVSGHSPLNDFHRWIARLFYITKRAMAFWFPGLGCVLIAIVLPWIKSKILKTVIIGGWLGICFLIARTLMAEDLSFPLLNGGDSPIGLAFILTIPIYSLFKNKRVPLNVKLELWSCVLLYFCMVFGSDGYVERVKIAFTLPVLVSIVWSDKTRCLHSYLKYALGITTAAFSLMLACQLLYVNSFLKRDDVGVLNVKPFNGISTGKVVEEEILQVKPAIDYLRTHNIRYAYLGNHYLIELAYGPDNGLSFHEYHGNLYDVDSWLEHKDAVLPRIDAVVYPYNMTQYAATEVLADLAKEGFNDFVVVGNATIIYRAGFRKT